MLFRSAVTALIAAAVYGVCKVSLVVQTENGYQPAVKTIILCVIVFGLLQVKKLQKYHPAFWLLFAVIIGIVFRF